MGGEWRMERLWKSKASLVPHAYLLHVLCAQLDSGLVDLGLLCITLKLSQADTTRMAFTSMPGVIEIGF